MATLLQRNPATGSPGIEPRWTRSDKDGVGAAYSALSRVWFTVSKGILNEIYYPTVDRPQVRDLQYLITDGETFFRDERQLDSTYEWLASDTLGYRITNSDPEGRYRIIKEIIADPHQDCVLVHTRLEANAGLLAKLRLFALLAPHLEVGDRGNNGNVVETNWGKVVPLTKTLAHLEPERGRGMTFSLPGERDERRTEPGAGSGLTEPRGGRRVFANCGGDW